MTENEIIQILKDNKEKGIAFGFLPDEVIQFTLKHKENLKFHDSEGFWIDTECQHKEGYEISIHEIVCLPEDFELKNKSEDEWIEFDIDKNGQFTVEFCKGSLDYCYDWFNWWKLLEKSKEYDYGFTAFGGWQYKNCKAWFMQTMLFQEDHYISCEFGNETCKIEPAIPIKIRFWRISK